MSYVGADAQALDDLRTAVAAAGDEVSARRQRVAALFAEAGETDVVGPGLPAVEAGPARRRATSVPQPRSPRDINTGTQVGIGGRVASGTFLIPFTKLAKPRRC